jgi:LuxR family maltose regulon positive regulatory protein
MPPPVTAERESSTASIGVVGARHLALESHYLFLHGATDRAREVLEPARDVHTLEVVMEQERVAVDQGDLEAATRLIERWPNEPDPRARLTRALWSAVLADLRGNESTAMNVIASVVREAEHDDHIGVFLSVGRPILKPARALYRVAPSAFLRRVVEHPVLTARPGPNGGHQRGLVDHLTEQEVIVLGYLPSRLSNAAIAEELRVSLNTIKTHLKHVYQKLDATGRAEAVDVAEQLGLL